MAVSDWMKPGLTDKSAVRILTVDQSLRRITAALRDGGGIQIAVSGIPAAFRWPKTGEVWYARKDNGIWHLDSRIVVDADDADKAVGEYSEGDVRIDSDVVRDNRGFRLMPVDMTNATNGVAPVWDATRKVFHFPGP